MGLYRRGGVWWFEFVFNGQRIRESSESSNRNVADRAERKRKDGLELGTHGFEERKQPLLFSMAAKKWLEVNKAHWSTSNSRIEGYNVEHLKPVFKNKLLGDIKADDVSRYQAARKKEGASARTINMEVGTLRAILRKHRLWANIQPDVRMLKGRGEIGRALTADEQHRLLTACRQNRSRSLYPAVLLALHTGLRNGELRLLKWRQIDLLELRVTVGKSKTEGGSGRIVPLSQTAAQCMKEWRSQFPEALPEHFVFPAERYGAVPTPGTGLLSHQALPYLTDPTKPIGSWKVSWTAAREAAGVSCRFHDARHSFISALAESQASDATIMSLAGHLSRKMMERYSHTRHEAKRQAISVLDIPGSPQKSPQSSGSGSVNPS